MKAAGALVVIVALLFVAQPAHAMDVRVKADATTIGPRVLTAAEARHRTAEVLLEHLGPAVAAAPEARVLTNVHGCRVRGDRGSCTTWLRVGDVTCRGVFRVWEYSKAYSTVWPRRVVCDSV